MRLPVYLLLPAFLVPAMAKAQSSFFSAVETVFTQMPSITAIDNKENYTKPLYSYCQPAADEQVHFYHVMPDKRVQEEVLRLSLLTPGSITPVKKYNFTYSNDPGQDYFSFQLTRNITLCGQDSLQVERLRTAFSFIASTGDTVLPAGLSTEKQRPLLLLLGYLNTNFRSLHQQFSWQFRKKGDYEYRQSILSKWSLWGDSLIFHHAYANLGDRYKCQLHTFRVPVHYKDVKAVLELDGKMAFMLSRYNQPASLHEHKGNGGCDLQKWETERLVSQPLPLSKTKGGSHFLLLTDVTYPGDEARELYKEIMKLQ